MSHFAGHVSVASVRDTSGTNGYFLEELIKSYDREQRGLEQNNARMAAQLNTMLVDKYAKETDKTPDQAIERGKKYMSEDLRNQTPYGMLS